MRRVECSKSRMCLCEGARAPVRGRLLTSECRLVAVSAGRDRGQSTVAGVDMVVEKASLECRRVSDLDVRRAKEQRKRVTSRNATWIRKKQQRGMVRLGRWYRAVFLRSTRADWRVYRRQWEDAPRSKLRVSLQTCCYCRPSIRRAAAADRMDTS